MLGIAFLPRRSALGFAAAVLALARLRLPRLRRAWRSSPATRCWRRAILSIFFALALLGWRLLEPRQPLADLAGRSSPRVVRLMFLVWLPNQWDLDRRVDTDLTNQARIENDLSDLVDEGALRSRSAARSPCRTTAPSRGSPSASTCGRPTSSAPARQSRRKAQARRSAATSSSRPVELRDPQLHPRPQRQDQLQRRRTPGRLPRSRPQRVLDHLQPLR